ncbi:hypothetical protein BSLG_009351 [Batrachochytrium salamandrivorans]|nr:hypothetical protein BSLG_009351 [Batrachochytrium salamandrivorans]
MNASALSADVGDHLASESSMVPLLPPPSLVKRMSAHSEPQSFKEPKSPLTHPLLAFNPAQWLPPLSTPLETASLQAPLHGSLLTSVASACRCPLAGLVADHGIDKTPRVAPLLRHVPNGHPCQYMGVALISQDAKMGEHPNSQAMYVQMEPFIKLNGKIDGFFIPRKDADLLGMAVTGMEETCYGHVNRFPPLGLMLFNKQLVIQDVFELPAAFANSVYSGGIVGLDIIHALGLSVMCDRGMIYVWDPEHSPYHSSDALDVSISHGA